MSQVVLLNIEGQVSVMRAIKGALRLDRSIDARLLDQVLDRVSRAMRGNVLRLMSLSEEESRKVEAIYYALSVEGGRERIDEAMFCCLQYLGRETGIRLMEHKYVGCDLGYDELYYVFLRAMGLLALAWQISRFGGEPILRHADLIQKYG